ncbi:MAG: 3'-5' exonuclease [Kiritimatiellae bacterium]|nr:3'-5' exonuclease [Kiritimatiellia bacterium]
MTRLHLDRPLAFFDVESTGANWKTDRIIDLAIVKRMPDGAEEALLFHAHPGMPIPPESTAVHGIRDADVVGRPPFAELADSIAAAFEGCDLAGFNLLRFDIPILQAEFKRAERVFPMDGRRVVDVQRIFHRKEPRDLSAAVRFYCGGPHTEAHSALGDTQATLQVLLGQLERYPDLPGSVEDLAEFSKPTVPAHAFDAEGKLQWDADGDLVLNFGVFKGAKMITMAAKDPGYLEWMLRKSFGPEVETAVRQTLAGQAPRRTTV